MEKRIRILSCITIIAILAFLGMQTYWLYGRYMFSLNELETDIAEKMTDILSEDMTERTSRAMALRPDSLPGDMPITNRSSFSLNNNLEEDNSVTRNVTITRQIYSAHRLLGIEEPRVLTSEEQKLAAAIVMDSTYSQEEVETSIQTFSVSDAPSDAAIWAAYKNWDLEISVPLDSAKIDSVFDASGLTAELHLIVGDTIQWTPTVDRRLSIVNPSVTVTYPYSEFERKNVRIECRISPGEILGNMGTSLCIVALLSLFLIICLVWQFSTVLKLSRLDKMRNSFITTMIHELKRPISTLKMCVSGIEHEKLLLNPDTRRELVTESRGALDNLSAYFSKLRDITFNDVEQIPLNLTTFSLQEMTDSVIDAIPLPDNKHVTIRNEVREGDVTADKTHLFNILNNLIENALKYSGENVDVAISSKTGSDYVEITVSDNGNGIAQNDLRHIFNRFYRGRETAGDVPGMGLGLTYVKLLVDTHGGDIAVESREGEGTKFTITLPQ
ncbi:MAG: HAMP domain-containing histidine kinase [Muribaculaceae bacterium]|nr:HAMP domain-containing histidine kinase [Muribaculaceae bacterium]